MIVVEYFKDFWPKNSETTMSNADKPVPKGMPFSSAVFGGLGVIPFAVGALLANIDETAATGQWLIIGYGAVILSFLGGIQWGVGLAISPRAWLPYTVAIIISLTGWVAMLLPPLWGLALLAAGFVAALVYDAISAGVFRLPGWFMGLRSLLTVCVVGCLALAALPLIP